MPIYSANSHHCPGRSSSGNRTSAVLHADAMLPPVNPYCPTGTDSLLQGNQSGCPDRARGSCECRNLLEQSVRSNPPCECRQPNEAAQSDSSNHSRECRTDSRAAESFCGDGMNPSCLCQDVQSAASSSPCAQECGCHQESSAQSSCQEESCGSSRRTRAGLSAFATGYAAGSISLSEDQPVIFPAFSSQKARSVIQRNGTFTLAKPGTYQITAIVNVPADSDVDAALHLTANGEVIPGSVTRVSPSSCTGTYILSAIVISDGSATVALTASQELTLTGAGASDVLAAITFLRLA